MVKRTAFLLLFLGCFAAVGRANTTHTLARVVVPDGTLYVDNSGSASFRWFAFVAEAGRSYAVEAYNTNDYPPKDRVRVDLFEADGTTDFFTSNTGICGSTASAAPSVEGINPGNEGSRCLFYPSLTSVNGLRLVKIRVQNPDNQPPANANACLNCLFRIRVRETTITSRWSVNGYNMFVAIHNQGISPISGIVLYYPDAPAAASAGVTSDSFTIPALGSIQYVHNSGTLNPNHGGLQILIYGGGSNGGVDADVQTYAYAPAANNFNFFVINRPNHGGANSQGYGN